MGRIRLVSRCVVGRLDALRLPVGDSAGVVELSPGMVAAVCPDGYFWIAPACRNDTAKCVPWLTGGNGWGFDDMMQKATAYGMPLALGTPKEWTTTVREVKSIFYWWVPDTTFVDIDPTEIVYPPYDFAAYTSGDKRTQSASQAIDKIVSQDLTSMAPVVEAFVRNIRFGLNDVMNMLKDMGASGNSSWAASGNSSGDIACGLD